jgi:hypothetical protein
MIKAVFEFGRKLITSPRIMSLLPWVSASIIVMGLTGTTLGIIMVFRVESLLPGLGLSVLGCGEIICGVVLFFTMTVVEDLLGLI